MCEMFTDMSIDLNELSNESIFEYLGFQIYFDTGYA